MLYGLSKQEIARRVNHLLELLDLGMVCNRKAKALSKGMRQRLLIAMSLISEPRVLFLDEPTSGLDVMSARKIRALIRDLARNGTTILLTTHSIEEAGTIYDRVVIMNRNV